MHTFVTGGTGFVGSWLVDRLLNDNHRVDLLVRKPELYTKKHPNLNILKGDITDPESLKQLSEKTDVIFHLAGLVAYKKKQRAQMEKVNVQGTKNIVEECKNKNIKKFIHMSSTCAVGVSFDGKTPLTEDSEYNIRKFDFGYFETKRLAEEFVIEQSQKGLINTSIINPSTIYGAGDAEKGSRSVQLKVAKGKFPFYTSGGVNIIGVRDVVDCLIKAVELGKNGERYIITGENISIKKLFTTIAEYSGQKAPSILLPNFVLKVLGVIGDILTLFGKNFPVSSENAKISTFYHWFDSSKAQKELGLSPLPATTYIKESIEWVKENKL